MDTMQRGDVDAEADAVDLVTFHGAKGLEWPVVHLAGLEDGFVPIAYAKKDAQLDEERRLLYVALTRAKQELHLSWAMERTFGTKTVKRQPAPLLDILAGAIATMDPSGSVGPNWRDQIAKTRRQIPVDDTVEEDADVLETLRTWRQRKAKAAGVPPHVIVTDQTLKVIAEQLPTGIGQLATMPGMRPVKLQRYGQELLDVVGSVTPGARQG